MKIADLMKIHFIYLFSKKNLLILTLFILIIFISNTFIIYNAKMIAGSTIEIIDATWEMVFTFNKLLLILLASYMMNNFCLPLNDEYRVLFLIDLDRKEKYFISKILVLIFVITILTLIIFVLFIISFLILNLDFKIEVSYLKGYILIYFQMLVYGLLSSNFAILTRSTLSSILSFIIYLIVDFFHREISILNTFFPLILYENYEIFFGKYIINLLVISTFYFIIYTLITRGKNY